MSSGRTSGTVVKNRPETDARAKIWQSMRVLLRFDAAQLAVTSTAEVSNCLRYITALRVAGYLRLVQKGSAAARRKAVYQLVRNTGPKAPITRKTGDVYDPNNNNIHTPVAAMGERSGKNST